MILKGINKNYPNTFSQLFFIEIMLVKKSKIILDQKYSILHQNHFLIFGQKWFLGKSWENLNAKDSN